MPQNYLYGVPLNSKNYFKILIYIKKRHKNMVLVSKDTVPWESNRPPNKFKYQALLCIFTTGVISF